MQVDGQQVGVSVENYERFGEMDNRSGFRSNTMGHSKGNKEVGVAVEHHKPFRSTYKGLWLVEYDEAFATKDKRFGFQLNTTGHPKEDGAVFRDTA